MCGGNRKNAQRRATEVNCRTGIVFVRKPVVFVLESYSFTTIHISVASIHIFCFHNYLGLTDPTRTCHLRFVEETGISLPGLFEPSLLPRLIPPPLIPGGGIRVGRPLHPRFRARLLGVHLHAAPDSPYSHFGAEEPHRASIEEGTRAS